MYDKMAISTYILKIVENDPFLGLQMRGKEMFNLVFYHCQLIYRLLVFFSEKF